MPIESLKQILAFLNLHQHLKNLFIPSVHSWDRISFRNLWPDWPHPFLTMFTQNIFHQLLIYINLYQNAKIKLFIDLFLRYGWLKNPAVWLAETFWPISQEKKFPQIWDLCSNTASNINFHYSSNSAKSNDLIFQ